MANTLPRVIDRTVAFKERRLFIRFPNEFTGKNQIQNLELNWLSLNDARSGILNWMLEGLKRLLAQGGFTESKSQEETEIEFLRHSDTINAFLTDLGEFDKSYATTRSETLTLYKNYCESYDLEPENEKKFTQRLKETPKISMCKVLNERAWKGIRFKKIEDNETESSTLDNLITKQVTTELV